ncbi:hypothetical protein [Streptomyces sp. NPDC005548]|uniref:hypothetical protein n=1 Tax=Streptomyces sp. NPDC005548 TaxID=3364724 RepID=UPI0036C1AE78
MSTPAPYQQTPAVPAGQPYSTPAARAFLTEVEAALAEAARPETIIPTYYKDDTQHPAIGTTPPVTQPGRPPMSQSAVNASTVILCTGVASLPFGAAATGILWASGHADPTVIGLICGAPIALAVPILALSRLAKRAKEVVAAAPPVHNHHHTGPVHVDQRKVETTTKGLWATTRNELPR